MKNFDNNFIQRIKDSLPIEQVIGAYVPLKKKGRSFWACCPFHQEKTPSFSVSPDKGFYHCFGCNESGDIVSFVEKIDNITFPEAIEKLAEIARIEIPEKEMTYEEKKKAELSKQIYDVTELASIYFYNCLTKTDIGKEGYEYFLKRHLSDEIIKKFKLGFAPPEWHRLYSDFTSKKKISPEILQIAGLVGYKNGKHYDIFRNRCMFPILNLKGKTVAFGGRVMDDSLPKYLNSPESVIFNKRKLLFALYQALPEIREKRQAIMVEGYMDAISLHAHGITNVVASLGTAFTIEQARLLKRYADELIFNYDMDAAGQNATKRALEIAGNVGLKLRVVRLGDGKDPDEFINAHGREAYLESVAQAQPATDYLFSAALKRYDSNTLEGQQKILADMFDVLLAKGNSFYFNSFIVKMARRMQMDEGLIRSEALRYARKKNSNVFISQKQSEKIKSEDYETKYNMKRQKLLEEGFFRYCLFNNKLPEGWELLKKYEFADDFHKELFRILEKLSETNITEKETEKLLPREYVPRLAELLMNSNSVGNLPMEEYIRPLKKVYLQREYRVHTQRVAELLETDPQKAREEQLICIKLSEEIRNLSK
ncbi:MAG: DNA primase [Dialister micraerophilus]|uniref:DNA primase n=1 Tax=Dialister micraerophilus TaxID=309120 RepID=UPI00254D8784|nr:DNA primase [Dialister micraerophilus]MDK8253623.1 DNA primase [Dialister micraerophilus]